MSVRKRDGLQERGTINHKILITFRIINVTVFNIFIYQVTLFIVSLLHILVFKNKNRDKYLFENLNFYFILQKKSNHIY